MHNLLARNSHLLFDIFFALWLLMGIYTIFRLLRKQYSKLTINSALSALRDNLTNDGAEEFCQFVEGATIYNHPSIYSKLRAAWGLVRGSHNISKRMKEQVRNALLGRGVNV